MTDSTIASDLLKTFDIHGNLTSQITFYRLSLVDHSGDFLYFFICQISHTCIRIYSSLRKNTIGRCSSNTVDIGKTYFYSLVSW